jgi:hypothetical protein
MTFEGMPPAITPSPKVNQRVTYDALKFQSIESKGNVYDFFEFERIPDLQKRVQVTDPVQVFGPLITQGSFTILFGAPKVGKSIVLFQIAASVASGKDYGMECHLPPQPVLYIDVENKDQTIARRIQDHDIHPNLIRVKLRMSFDGNIRQELPNMIATAMEMHGAKVVILDNLSYFEADIEGDTHKETNKFLRPLNALCQAHGATIIAGHHRPKGDEGPMTLKSVSGSSEYARRCDAVVGMGKPDGNTQARYLVQLITRDEEPVNHGGNVAMGHLEEVNGLLQWVYTPAGNCNERSLFDGEPGAIRVGERVLRMFLEDPDVTPDEITDEIPCSKATMSYQRSAAKAITYWQDNPGATGVEVKRATGVDDRAIKAARKHLKMDA